MTTTPPPLFTTTPTEVLLFATTTTSELVPVVSEYLSGATVTTSYDFNSNRLDGWSFSSNTVHPMTDGTVQLNGEGSWGSASLALEKPIQPGTAVIVDFKAQAGPMELYVDRGTFGDPAYHRVGIHIQQDGRVTANIFEGNTFLQPALSGNLGRVAVEKLYSMMVALSPDGAIRMVIWDANDPAKLLQYNAAYPDLAGKSLNFAAGVNTGVLNVDQVDLLVFASLPALPEVPTPVPVQQATPIPGQPTSVSPGATATNKPEQPPGNLPTEPVFGVWYFDTGRNQWVCKGCVFDINLIYTNPRNLAYLAYDYATKTTIEQKEFLSPDQFMADYNSLYSQGYRPYGMTMFQNPGDGDPRDGVDQLNLAVYVMHINNPNLP